MDKIIFTLKGFNDVRDWKKYHTIKNLICALNVESSELLELVQWKNDLEIIDQSSEFWINLRDEIADCFIYLLILCDKLELNEEEIKELINQKIKVNAIKYPVEEKGLFEC